MPTITEDHAFAGLNAQAELVRAGAGAYFDPGHGRLMKEWIAVPEGAAPWLALAKEACAFVSGAGAPTRTRRARPRSKG